MTCAQVCQFQAINESIEINQEGIYSIKDVCVDIIHFFKGQMLDDESLEIESQNTNPDFVRANWRAVGRDYPQKIFIYDITYSAPNYDYYVMNLEIWNNDDDDDDDDYELPPLHPKLIDWDNLENLELDIFSNDHYLSVYVNVAEPITPKIFYTSESSNTSCNQESVKLSRHKNEIKQGKRPSTENHCTETLDQSRIKKRDISNGENLLEVQKDGNLDILPVYFEERSSILIEPIKVINSGT